MLFGKKVKLKIFETKSRGLSVPLLSKSQKMQDMSFVRMAKGIKTSSEKRRVKNQWRYKHDN